jgi:hypothetical protein
MRKGYVRDFSLLRVQQVIADEFESHMRRKFFSREMVNPSWRREMKSDGFMGVGSCFDGSLVDGWASRPQSSLRRHKQQRRGESSGTFPPSPTCPEAARHSSRLECRSGTFYLPMLHHSQSLAVCEGQACSWKGDYGGQHSV